MAAFCFASFSFCFFSSSASLLAISLSSRSPSFLNASALCSVNCLTILSRCSCACLQKNMSFHNIPGQHTWVDLKLSNSAILVLEFSPLERLAHPPNSGSPSVLPAWFIFILSDLANKCSLCSCITSFCCNNEVEPSVSALQQASCYQERNVGSIGQKQEGKKTLRLTLWYHHVVPSMLNW